MRRFWIASWFIACVLVVAPAVHAADETQDTETQDTVWAGIDAAVLFPSFSIEPATALGAHGRLRVAPLWLAGGSLTYIDAEVHYEKCRDHWCPKTSTAFTADVELHPLSFLPIVDPWAGARAGVTYSAGNWASSGEDRSGVQPLGELAVGLDLALWYFALGASLRGGATSEWTYLGLFLRLQVRI